LVALASFECMVAGVCGDPGVATAECIDGRWECTYTSPHFEPETELSCDARDNDCDGETDEELSTDYDEDGHYAFGSCLQPADDCDDSNKLRHPEYPELCDGLDNDCDTVVDPIGSAGCQDLWLDVDEDDFGAGEPLCRCAPGDSYTAIVPGDCYDYNPEAHPYQEQYYTEERGDGSYDYNCVNGNERLYTTVSSTCALISGICQSGGVGGYVQGIAPCGGSKLWRDSCNATAYEGLQPIECNFTFEEQRAQLCR
jgi:hypothetical protein